MGRVVSNDMRLWRRAPWGLRVRHIAGVMLLLAALVLFAVSDGVAGTIAAILYVLDLGLVWPALRARGSGRDHLRSSVRALRDSGCDADDVFVDPNHDALRFPAQTTGTARGSAWARSPVVT